MQSGYWAWPSIGSFPVGREYLKYIRDMPSRQFFVNMPKRSGLSSRIALLLAFFIINRQNTKSVRWLGLANYRIFFGGSVVLIVHPWYAPCLIRCEFAKKIWSQQENSLFFAHFLIWVTKQGPCPVIGRWPSMGSLPEGLKYLIYISSSPPIQYCINLPKLFGLSPRTAFLSRIFHHKSPKHECSPVIGPGQV